MKRNDALKAITKVLKNWEDCKLTNKTSNEILTALEELGIICPPEIQVGEYIYINGEVSPVMGMEWEK